MTNTVAPLAVRQLIPESRVKEKTDQIMKTLLHMQDDKKKPSNKVTNHDVPLLSKMEMDSSQFNVIRLIAVYFSPLSAKINKYFCEYRVLQKVRLFTNTNFASKFSS